MNGVIQAVNENELALTSNTASLPFSIVDLRTRSAMNCCGFINHNQGSALFSILDGGVYRVNFNTNITSNTAGNVALGLFADGVLVPGTEMDATIAAPGDWENISFNKEIKVCCKGTVNLSIQSLPTTTFSGSGTPVVTDTQIPIVKNSNINITRLSGN